MVRSLLIAILVLSHALHSLPESPSVSTLIPAFHHTSWESSQFGAVYDTEQDSEGYIWLQTANGIYRFDGAKFLSVDEVTHGAVRNADGQDAALPSLTGGIWFMPHDAGLVFWKDGHAQKLSDTRCSGRFRAAAPDGSLWIANSSGLFHLKGQVCEAIGEKWGMETGIPSGLFVDREGTVWVKRWTGELLFLRPGMSTFKLSPYGAGVTTTLSSLGEAPDGSIWLADGHGLREVRAAGNAPVPARPPGIDHHEKDIFGAFRFLKDGSIWIATNKGVRWAPRPQQWATPNEMEASPGEDLTMGQGLSSDVVWSILIDKEDNAWMATNSGLDQMQRCAFHAIKLAHVQEYQFGIAPGAAGSVWTGSESMPLTHVVGNKVTTYPSVGFITSLKQGRDGIIWAATKGENHLWRSSGGSFEKIYYPYEAYQSIVALAVDQHNCLWISLRQYGVFRFCKGVWTNENRGIGQPTNVYGGMTDDEAGNVWFAFGHKLVEWNGERYLAFPLPDKEQRVFGSLLTVAYHHVWFLTKAGVELFTGGAFHLLRFSDASLPGSISGLVETAEGDLWTNGYSGATHVSRTEMARWFHNPEVAVSAEHLDTLDGLPGLASEPLPKPSLVVSREGRLWFATTKGIAWLDPLEYEQIRNRIPPPVVISYVSSNGTLRAAANDIAFSPHAKHLEIGYDALSFTIPQRVLFKYRLDGLDTEWQNAGTRREAFYNSLGPGRYRFRVLACNNDGVWNEVGATIAFRVNPGFYQTVWFRLLTILTITCVAWLIWNLRIRFITRDLQGRLTARLEERERISRELHDTLLQGIFGLTLRLQSSVDQLEDGHPVRADITQALNQSDAMMLKGRERIRDLRDIHVNDVGLVATLDAHGRHLQDISVAQFQLSVEGEPRHLTPPIEEELSLIGCEAITNAFRHAGASLIQLEIVYRWKVLQVRILDDGKGVEPSILAAGQRKDHWGLPSMRERAKKLHAKFRIGPGKNSGTVVEVEVPGAIVYGAGWAKWHRFWCMFHRGRKSR
jgi:signal transduction histidine kinase